MGMRQYRTGAPHRLAQRACRAQWTGPAIQSQGLLSISDVWVWDLCQNDGDGQ